MFRCSYYFQVNYAHKYSPTYIFKLNYFALWYYLKRVIITDNDNHVSFIPMLTGVVKIPEEILPYLLFMGFLLLLWNVDNTLWQYYSCPEYP